MVFGRTAKEGTQTGSQPQTPTTTTMSLSGLSLNTSSASFASPTPSVSTQPAQPALVRSTSNTSLSSETQGISPGSQTSTPKLSRGSGSVANLAPGAALGRSNSNAHLVDEQGVSKIHSRLMNSSGDMEQNLVSDAKELIDALKTSYDSVRNECRRPCVMLAGITGAGKSSVINTVFGINLAQVGVGSPVTVNFTRYEIPDMPVILYDAKGFECGEDLSKVSQETLDFVGSAKDHIHVVWYVINSASARFQPFEVDLCRQVFRHFPILFILNKADLSPQDARDTMRKCILDFNFPNTVGVFDVIADKARMTLPTNLKCPSCASRDVSLRKKDRRITCDACSYSGILHIRTGLEDVVLRTSELLSENAVVSFISAQRISFDAKEKKTRDIVTHHYDHCIKGHSTHFERNMADMLSKISLIWGFKGHGQQCASEVAHSLLGRLTFWNRLTIAFSRDHSVMLESVAVGIVWAASLRDLTTLLVAGSVFVDGHAEKDKMDQAMKASFVNFNQDFIFDLTRKISKQGLLPVLDYYLTSLK